MSFRNWQFPYPISSWCIVFSYKCFQGNDGINCRVMAQCPLRQMHITEFTFPKVPKVETDPLGIYSHPLQLLSHAINKASSILCGLSRGGNCKDRNGSLVDWCKRWHTSPHSKFQMMHNPPGSRQGQKMSGELHQQYNRFSVNYCNFGHYPA